MNNTPSLFWCNWLKIVLIGVSLFSLILVVVPGLTVEFFNFIAYQGNNPEFLHDPKAIKFLKFVYAILGAVMLGWGLALYYIVKEPYRQGKKWAWFALFIPVSIWFVLDSFASLYYEFSQNAVFNSIFYLAFFIPLIATRTMLKND